MSLRLLLVASLVLTLSACVPYSHGGSSYYRSEVYSAPAATYYGNGNYYQRDYYAPAPRYYAPQPRYYPAPRYYTPAPRAVYRAYPNRGWGHPYRHGREERGGHWGDRQGRERGYRH